MSKFFFHVRDRHEFSEDTEGVDLRDAQSAEHEAILAAREIVADLVLSGKIIDGQVFEIVDEKGLLLKKVPFKSVLRLD